MSIARHTGVVLALFAAGCALRLLFVFHQPFTNDEGSYLYDAKTLLEGRLPAGDILAKAPAVVALFLGGVALTDGSLFAARLVNTFVSTLTALPLLALGSHLFGQRVGGTAGALWLFAAAPVLFSAFGQTETAVVFFGASALALWVRSLRVGGRTANPRDPGTLPALLAGVSFALAFASRKTALALVLPGALLWWVSPRTSRERKSALAALLLGAGAVFAPWIFFIYRLHGIIGIREALGFGYAGIITGYLEDPQRVSSWVGSPWWAVRVGVRTAAPLLGLALLGVGVSLPGIRKNARHVLVAVPVLWFGTLAGLYAVWPTLLPDYLPEFFPTVVLLGAAGIAWAMRTISVRANIVLGSLVLAWNFAIFWSVYRTPWIGMFTAEAVRTAAAEVQRHVPREEPLFTAALLVPYLSGHRVLFDIAHPFWYRYAFIPPPVRQAFLPPLADIESAVRTDVRWALVEQFTDYAYLRHESDLLSFIWREFTLVRSIPNRTGYRDNPLLLWRGF